MSCGDVLNIEDLRTAKRHQVFEAEVITGKRGGVAGGTPIDFATNPNTGQTQKTLPAILRDIGFTPVSWDFTTGGTLGANDRDKAVYDPVSKNWYKWNGVLPHTVAAGTNPVGDANWTPISDIILRDDLSSDADGKGDAMVAVKQPYAGAVATTQHEVNKRLVNILDFGGAGDGVTDNAVALQNASAAVGEWGVIYFPALGGNNYWLGDNTASVWTKNRILKTDEGVYLSCSDGGHIDQSARYASEVRVHYTANDVYFYYPKSTGEGRADRPVWMSPADRDYSRVEPVFPNNNDPKFGMYYRQFNNSDDNMTVVAPYATSESGVAFRTSGTSYQVLAMAPLGDGEELSAIFDGASTTEVYGVVCIACTGGRVWYTVKATGGQVGRNIKYTGASIISGPVDYQGGGTDEYDLFASDITIRRNSPTSFTLMANGFTVDTVNTSSLGEITDIGFGSTGDGELTISSPVRRKCATRENGRFLHVCCFGDSISADSMGLSWPQVLKSSFDGMNGIRFPTVDNYAVAGDDSAAQLRVMNGVNLGRYNLCLIMVGVNDIQGGVRPADYVANMRTMINNAQNNGNTVIVACPTMFYGRNQTGGKGQPTTRSAEGKWHRSSIRRLCADMGVKFIEMNQVIGPVFASYVSGAGFPEQDPTVNDNIHPTANTCYLFARAFYNAIYGWAQAGGDKSTGAPLYVSGVPASGWSVDDNEQPRYTRDPSGTITLDGLINRTSGSIADGSIIYTLPPALRPRYVTRQIVWADATTARVIIEPTGSVKVFGMTSGSWLSLGGITYQGQV